MGKDKDLHEEEFVDYLVNEILDDYEWYIASIEDGIGNENESLKSLIKEINMFLNIIRSRNETLNDYPRLKDALKGLLRKLLDK
jgi:hypothetical protein